MEQSRGQKQLQYNSMEPGHGNQELHSASHAYILDPMSSMSVRPPNLHVSDVKPVLNYSIQTGEEFALEFMRDRVNPRKPSFPNTVGDPHYAPGYMELKGILGISHTGSESGSDISMLNIAEKDPKEFERKNSSLYEDRSNYGSVQSVPRTSLGYESNRGVGYTSSEASNRLSARLKILCSFGGRVLPRPSDGRLRYVGGETRIIRIRKDISWQELKQKILMIYSEAHVVKYQLPGEDLDALVSVSCDEDIQNMMEECNVLEDREGSQKLRIFLFSAGDLDDAQFGLGCSDADSEIQYVVAVNGMDIGSKRNLTSNGLASSSGNILDELDRKNTEEIGRAARDLVGVTAPPITNTLTSSSAPQSFPQTMLGSSSAFDNDPQFSGHTVHHREVKQFAPHYNQNSSTFTPLGEVPASMPLQGHTNQWEGLTGQSYGGLQLQNPQMLVEELKPKPDVTINQATTLGKLQPSEKDHQVQPHDGNVINNYTVEETSVAAATPTPNEDLLSSAPKNEGKNNECTKTSSVNAVTTSEIPQSGDDDQHSVSSSTFGPVYMDSGPNAMDLGYLDQPAPQRIYYSERLPREQLELLNRLSKSDDSLGSQLLLSHSRSDIMQQDPSKESVEKSHESNMDPYSEDLSSAKPLYTVGQIIDDGLARLQNYKEVADTISQNSKLRKEVLDSELKQTGSDFVTVNDSLHKDRMLEVESETSNLVDTASEVPTVSNVASVIHPDISQENASVAVSASGQGDILIDINDRFPRDFLSDIFSKAMLSEDSTGISPPLQDGPGLSLNMENHEPKRWSYFQKLAQEEFRQKDVSLIDQDHLGFSSALRDINEGDNGTYHFTHLTRDEVSVDHVDSQLNFGDDEKHLPARTVAVSEFDQSQVKVTESMHFDVMMDNLRAPVSEYEIEMKHVGLPPLDPSLGDFDLSTLQVIKNDDLEELRELGSGTFGTVYYGKWRGTDVAIKRIKKCCFTGRSSEQERLTVEFWREADILSKLHHPNVMAFYGVVQDGPGGTLATVTEYMG
ncbi:uncharacterized protein LOC110817034 isoform X2 [Carica papaya]|uniref:uncharacterized protein LOC110817034 isoform X2 n=1 Tax=Carica papaya TaxID=3649 RepID=UPI000B8CF389|nr:uncharacterized protein LOC110817034 isoform X2 [Carica papaya]